MSTSTAPDFGTFIPTLLQFIKTDALKLAAPALGAFFTSIGANPSKINVMNQLILLEASLLADLPQLEQDTIKQIGAFVQSEIASATATSTAS